MVLQALYNQKMIIASLSNVLILLLLSHIKEHLNSLFGIKDLGLLHYFLGIEVGYYDNGITLSQAKFIKDLLSDCPFDLPRKAFTPLPLNLKLTPDDGNPS